MKKTKKTSDGAKMSAEEAAKTIGKGLSFGAAEAYKLLRANLSFSLPDSDKCKVFGVTSSLRGEGKSTTSINLAYTIAETGKKTLLVEADMRLPVLAKRINVHQAPGLSNLLAGQSSLNDVLQNSGLMSNLLVICAGSIPPNPAELLESHYMERTLQVLREHFDVIIVDLPPVTAVSDAIMVSKYLDGMLLVCRQNYCDKRSLDETVRQLQFSQTKLLGFVATDSNMQQKGYYKRYGKNYGYKGYGYGYGSRKKRSGDDDPARA